MYCYSHQCLDEQFEIINTKGGFIVSVKGKSRKIVVNEAQLKEKHFSISPRV